jgi:hypothetical protein
MNVPVHAELSTLWRFSKQDREARCVLLRHPAGLEMRYVFNGVVLIGMVSGDEGLLMERAHQWRLRLVADGWDEVEQNPGAVENAVQAARAGLVPEDAYAAVFPNTRVNVPSGTRSHSGR